MPDAAEEAQAAAQEAAELCERLVDNLLAGRVAGLAVTVQYADGTSSSHWRWWGPGNPQVLCGSAHSVAHRVMTGVDAANEGTAPEAPGKFDA